VISLAGGLFARAHCAASDMHLAMPRHGVNGRKIAQLDRKGLRGTSTVRAMTFAMRVALMQARFAKRSYGHAARLCKNPPVVEKIDPGQETRKWRLLSSRVNPKIQGNPFGLSVSILWSPQ